MTSEETTPQERVDFDDQAPDPVLGSVLGSALRAQTDAPIEPPPTSEISERAAVLVRVRAVRRAIVGIAASVTLLAGGVVAYNAFGSDDGTPIVATEPYVDTTPETPTTVAPDEVLPPDDPGTSALTWTEYDPSELFGADLPDVYGGGTVGDGRVFARAWAGNAGSQILISDNGSDWTRADIPTGVSPQHVDISGDRWLLAGVNTSGSGASYLVFYSDDQGANWTEVALNPTTEGEQWIMMARASGQNMVIVVTVPADRTARDLQIRALITAEGLVSDETLVESWSLQGNTVSFGTAGAPVAHSFEISDEARAALDSIPQDEKIRVYSSTGGTATMTGQYVSWHTTGSSNSEGFYVAMTTPDDELLLTSVDGVTWTETSIDNADAFTSGLQYSTREGEWFVARYEGETRIKSLDQLNQPESTTATMAGMQHLISLDVGPAGMVAAVFPEGSTGTQPESLLGWSTDGNNWEWQIPSEAFGIGSDQISVNFAVGNDFVLAQVTEFTPMADSETLTVQAPRWFKATVQ